MDSPRGDAWGQLFQVLRIRQGQTLRAFCREHGFDPGNTSKLERGRLSPPRSSDRLAVYAKALGMEENSDLWFEFFDRAAISRGQIPPALLLDEEVLSRLPLVFCTLRGQPTDHDINELIELIRRT